VQVFAWSETFSRNATNCDEKNRSFSPAVGSSLVRFSLKMFPYSENSLSGYNLSKQGNAKPSNQSGWIRIRPDPLSLYPVRILSLDPIWIQIRPVPMSRDPIRIRSLDSDPVWIRIRSDPMSLDPVRIRSLDPIWIQIRPIPMSRDPVRIRSLDPVWIRLRPNQKIRCPPI